MRRRRRGMSRELEPCSEDDTLISQLLSYMAVGVTTAYWIPAPKIPNPIGETAATIKIG